LLNQLHATVDKAINKVNAELRALIAADVAGLRKTISTVESEIAKVGGISAKSVASEIASGVKAAESSAAALDKSALAGLETAAVAGIGSLWGTITGDVKALEGVI